MVIFIFRTVTSHLRNTTAETFQTCIGRSCMKLLKIPKRVDSNVKSGGDWDAC